MARLIVLLLVVITETAALPQEMKPSVEIRSEYLMTLEAPIEPPQFVGARAIVNVPVGGTVEGPRIKGRIIAPAGDWLYPMSDGSSRLDVRLTIKTDDDELIFMEYGGVMAFPKEAADRSPRGRN